MEWFNELKINEVLNLFDLLGTFVFAISGALAASTKKLDLFGATFITLVTALGGRNCKRIVNWKHSSWMDGRYNLFNSNNACSWGNLYLL